MNTVLITGASRGIGLEFVRQYLKKGWQVIATARNVREALDLQNLKKESPSLELLPLDVCDDKSIHALSETLNDRSLDMLINNAGTSGVPGVTIGNLEKENFLKLYETNCYGVLKVSELLLPSLMHSSKKLIVVVSSSMGSISENQQGRSYAYRASKAGLNCVMRSFAIDIEKEGVKVLMLHPGWVKTDMGGENGLLEVNESVTKMIHQIETHGENADASRVIRFDGDLVGY